MELSNNIYGKITKLCEEGNNLVEYQKYKEAISSFMSALKLLPEPHYIWEAATWIYTALGDTYFQMKNYNEALRYLTEAQKCPDGLGNPFICVRLGECCFELSDMDRSREYLIQAYMLEGKDIFSDADPKYLDFISSLI